MSTTNNNGYNDANHSNNDHEPSSSYYYMVQESSYHSLDEQNNANTLENESKLSTILHQSHVDDNDLHRQHPEPSSSSPPKQVEETIGHMTTYIFNQLKYIYRKETLLVEVLIVIMLAKIYPRIGTEFVFPEITAHWIAVMTIFFFSGFGLRLDELNSAASNWRFITFMIVYNFLGISSVVNFFAQYFYKNELVSEDLMKGMIICSCLSMPTNLMLVLTISSNGDEAVALFAATVMTLLSVFVTPVLVFWYLHEEAEVDLQKTYRTIALRVLLPVFIGVVLRQSIRGAEAFADERKKLFLTIREKCLVFVVYCTFCKTFTDETDSTRSQIIMMAICQVILLIFVMCIAWVVLFTIYNREPRLRVVGLFGCVTKTTALGIPLISAIYEDNPKLGMYTLPLLIWYPAQLIIGTILAPRLKKFVNYKEQKFELERQSREDRLKTNQNMATDSNATPFSLDGFCVPVPPNNHSTDLINP